MKLFPGFSSSCWSLIFSDPEKFMRPDGDYDISSSVISRTRVPGCDRCGGIIKPDVVFFGDGIPKGKLNILWCVLSEHGEIS